ncbi:hypothetical protein VTI28DRAFT_4125 [Corynascus sepedonium]
MHLTVLAAVFFSLPLCSGGPLDTRHSQPRRIDEPCKQVRDHVAKWIVDNGIVPRNLTGLERFVTPDMPPAPIRPSIAVACLKSIPLYKDSALQQLEFLRPFFEWQSTIDYLREAPQGYLSEGVDLLGGLDDIAAKVKKQKGGYSNELEFLTDLYTLTSVRTRDFHFHYSTQLFDLFSFVSDVRFVSISVDGLSKPKIYLHGDVKSTQDGYTPSPVSTIDGVPALEYLQKASVYAGWSHDPDARFNSLMPSVANDANPNYGTHDPSAPTLKDTTIVKLKNGTRLEFANKALVRANFTSIASGTDLYNVYGQGNGTGPQVFPWPFYRAIDDMSRPAFDGYPEVVDATKWTETVGGFFPDGPDVSDVAVLTVNSFAGISNEAIFAGTSFSTFYQDFFNATVNFIRAAKAFKRTKLILDVQGNSGGYVQNVATIYWALFPGDALPILWQARAHPQYAWLADQLWNETTSAVNGPWPMGWSTKPDNSSWASFDEFYGPYDGPRGQHTHPSIQDLSNYYSSFFTGRSNASDYNRYRIPWTTPPFQPEDIIILTDGQCGSACSMLTTLLTHGHGVRTVALGGRPLHAPMQAVGQTRGGPVQSFLTFPDVDRSGLPPDLALPPLSSPPGAPLNGGGGSHPPLRVSQVNAIGWASLLQFNVADTLLPGEDDAEVVPMQFRYEAANCRLFFTWDMARNITAVWKATAGAAWRGAKCVPGSTTNADGTIGGVPKYRKEVEDQYRLGKGPGAVGGRKK